MVGKRWDCLHTLQSIFLTSRATMVLYKQTNVTAKNGINFVRFVIESAGSLFHKIEAENDLGIDGLIELVRDEKPLNCQVAVQVKSGQSYYNASGEEV